MIVFLCSSFKAIEMSKLKTKIIIVKIQVIQFEFFLLIEIQQQFVHYLDDHKQR